MPATPNPKSMSFNRWTLLLLAAVGISSFARFFMSYRYDDKAAMAFGAGFLMILFAALIVGAIASLIARRSSRVFNIAAGIVLAAGFCLLWYWPIKHALFPAIHDPPPPQTKPRKPNP